MSINPEKMKAILDEASMTPGDLAQIDQRQKALEDNADLSAWWMMLMMLSKSKGNIAAYAMALHNLRVFLMSRNGEALIELAIFLVNDMVLRVAKHEHDDDIYEAVKSMVIDGQMPLMEKFVDTGGASCPGCGADEGWSDDHRCGNVQE